MIQSKGNEVWTTTPETHRLMFKAEEGTEHPTYFTRIYLAKGLGVDDVKEIPLSEIPQEEEEPITE